MNKKQRAKAAQEIAAAKKKAARGANRARRRLEREGVINSMRAFVLAVAHRDDDT